MSSPADGSQRAPRASNASRTVIDPFLAGLPEVRVLHGPARPIKMRLLGINVFRTIYFPRVVVSQGVGLIVCSLARRITV